MTTWNDALEAALTLPDDLVIYHSGHAGDYDAGARHAARKIAAAIRALKREEAAADDTHAAGMREGRERERADVVAWLRKCGSWRQAVDIGEGQHIGAAAESGERGGE